MKLLCFIISILIVLNACNPKSTDKATTISTQNKTAADTATSIPDHTGLATKQGKNLTDFIPNGFLLSEKDSGDLNKDGIIDYILMIKGTDKSNIVKNRFDEIVDRNRRGIIVLFNKKDHYELALRNDTCFYSENEDGGVYFPPEIGLNAEKGNLYVHFAHGRYGYWRYTFRFQNGNFELIGYDASENHGPVVEYVTSINFMTNKKLKRENLNKSASSDTALNEVFKDTWETLPAKPLLRLSEIKSFDELDF